MRKRIYAAVLLTAAMLSSCGKIRGAEVSLGSSELFTDSDREQAANAAMNYFKKNFDGCELIEIHYAGDERSLDEKDWYGAADSCDNVCDVMVFLSEFYVKPNGGDGSLSTNSVYSDWQWIMLRNESGEWVHLDHGYG